MFALVGSTGCDWVDPQWGGLLWAWKVTTVSVGVDQHVVSNQAPYPLEGLWILSGAVESSSHTCLTRLWMDISTLQVFQAVPVPV